MKIITISYNDPGISWGPAIHFLELWNSALSLRPDMNIIGFAPSWTGKCPIISPRFYLKLFRIPAVTKARQMIFDLVVALRVLLPSKGTDCIYLRPSQFHLFTTTILYFLDRKLVLEMNGLVLDDAISSRRSSLFRSFVCWQERVLVNRANGIISVSQGITDAIRVSYKPKGKLITLNNGVGMHFFSLAHDISKFSNRGDDRIKILYVGTFTPWDGASKVVELAKKFTDIDFLFVGDGPGRNKIQTQATSNMIFLGQVAYSDLPMYYSNVDAGIVLYEVQRHKRVHLSSLKTLEYLASGLPVFTTKVPGQEIVTDLGCGVLCQEENILEEFHMFIEKLSEYRSNAQAGREVIRLDHSWESVAKKTLRFLDSLN